MKPPLVALLLLSLVLTGCVVDPGRGYGDRGYGDRGPEYQRHAALHGDQGQDRVWVR